MDYKKVIGQNVILKSGAIGKITDVTNYLNVQVDEEEKHFQISAFQQGFLRFEDSKLQDEINKELEEDRIQVEKAAQERLERERLAKLEREKANALMTEKERLKKRQSSKENEKNIAYKATYCDGNGMWFRRPCSEECMSRNISEGRSWCSRSLCWKHIIGKATLKDIEDKWRTTKDLCYESRMLEDFSVSAGLDDVTNKPRSFVKLAENRVVVLTTIEPGTRGYDRIILGAFLVDKIVKDEYGADKAISYPKYRIELTLEEARQMRFWDYYENKNAPDSERWGQGLIRYLNDDLSAKIIYDMIEIIKKRNNNSASLTNAEEFLNKYLNIIGRTIDEIA